MRVEWPSWADRPSGFRGRKAILNHASAIGHSWSLICQLISEDIKHHFTVMGLWLSVSIICYKFGSYCFLLDFPHLYSFSCARVCVCAYFPSSFRCGCFCFFFFFLIMIFLVFVVSCLFWNSCDFVDVCICIFWFIAVSNHREVCQI